MQERKSGYLFLSSIWLIVKYFARSQTSRKLIFEKVKGYFLEGIRRERKKGRRRKCSGWRKHSGSLRKCRRVVNRVFALARCRVAAHNAELLLHNPVAFTGSTSWPIRDTPRKQQHIRCRAINVDHPINRNFSWISIERRVLPVCSKFEGKTKSRYIFSRKFNEILRGPIYFFFSFHNIELLSFQRALSPDESGRWEWKRLVYKRHNKKGTAMMLVHESKYLGASYRRAYISVASFALSARAPSLSVYVFAILNRPALPYHRYSWSLDPPHTLLPSGNAFNLSAFGSPSGIKGSTRHRQPPPPILGYSLRNRTFPPDFPAKLK